jgi:TetR/AcrR family transcriptional regulator, ethionamide resistance regulator
MPPLPQAKARRSRAERQQTIRKRLFDALERLLAIETFPELTIDRIIGEAEISRSTFYFHFVDKATLLLALSEDIFATAADTAAPWWDMDPAEVTRTRLMAHLRLIFALYVEHGAVLKALVDAAGYEPLIQQRLAEMPVGYIDRLEAHLIRGQGGGVIHASLQPRVSAHWVVWMLERGLYQLVAKAEDDAEFDELLESATDLILNALYCERR